MRAHSISSDFIVYVNMKCFVDISGAIFKFREVFREKFDSGRSPGDGPKFRENFLPPGDLAGLIKTT